MCREGIAYLSLCPEAQPVTQNGVYIGNTTDAFKDGGAHVGKVIMWTGVCIARLLGGFPVKCSCYQNFASG